MSSLMMVLTFFIKSVTKNTELHVKTWFIIFDVCQLFLFPLGNIVLLQFEAVAVYVNRIIWDRRACTVRFHILLGYHVFPGHCHSCTYM